MSTTKFNHNINIEALCKDTSPYCNLEFKIWNFIGFANPLPVKLIFAIEIEKV